MPISSRSMSFAVISAENLGKRYRMSGSGRDFMLRDVVARAFAAPFRGLFGPYGKADKTNCEVATSRAEDSIEHIWALRNVSFEIKMGEVVGIVGQNGAGKSTLLKILSRITEPTEGEARIYGRVGSLLEVGTGFHSELTGRENIYLSGAILGMKKDEIDKKFDEIVGFAEVGKFVDIPVKHYSSGMYMRLAFAVAAHLEPEILIVDEVLAVGDAAFQKKCLGKMEAVAREGRTVLLVSHDLAMTERLCQRALLFEGGKLVMSGATDQVLSVYISTILRNTTHDFRSMRRDQGLLPIIRRLELLDERGRPVNSIPAGSDLTIVIHYKHSEPIKQASFGLTVESASGIKIFSAQTRSPNGPLPDFPPSGVVRCRIPRLPIVPGSYFITASCSTGNLRLDLIPRACHLKVTTADFYRTDCPSDFGNSLVLIEADWKVVGEIATETEASPY